MNPNTQAVKQFIRAKYAWPGGYPLYAIANDGCALCHGCTKDNAKLILRATRDNDGSGWNVVGVDVNYENGKLTCDNCGKRIESAYAE